ncbi:4-diphosphocytidyl-2-C-methyl-D-erythritol kinase [hydrothermal vent metagenome]|uniref:4-(cytidine 5'-diphospho)-2-C-methyl-D-erythritol kinase n=1 Tax=hydrothermal vent metagenome TaxID=652676 RepID=A0A1W1BQU9_9ZZZZ
MWLSPAKLNLFLHITSKRDDGYHNIQTIFQLLDFGDEIGFKIRQDTKIKRVFGNKNIPHEEDLLIKSARLLQQKYNINQGVEIKINKKIPIGGGLGGGSSNAAIVLMALNELWEINLSKEKLMELGGSLGADVPFFIFGKNAWAEGVGDKLQTITLPEDYFLVVSPNKHISTQKIFSSSLLTIKPRQLKIADFFVDSKKHLFVNDCLKSAIFEESEIKKVIDWLDAINRESCANMTGTGSCVFSRFSTKKQARQVLENLPEKWTGFVAKGVNSLANRLPL